MSTENLEYSEARKKMKSMVEDIKTAMMITNIGSKPVDAIPMTTKRVDTEGNIWFLSGMNSDHNGNIAKDSDVQLLYSDPKDYEFISIYGQASIVTEKDILEDLYSKVDDTWFKGEDDPNLSALKIDPKEAYFWDTKSNKYVSLFKMGVAAVTGDQKDIGEKGKLDL
ncbi:pyridoxamine 5'-phosphate oxidase family protein [Zunongwangia sp. HRR-M8]|uniref:pyridoxamine 5'-phosphate oxidase family protein n=1 Tax=Zunongwangia sp. HRR-M8 TaxID=3015170 RepID=UPI0022DD1671|nr:pyridoxamine 5'-phosphate oxidase family protein [Zunongwangia sp. HRR-M8]WBL22982.1 pyridoxamine 5'-phosphate oxidase family protein [Zunongwangia sp. HRR-M8]